MENRILDDGPASSVSGNKILIKRTGGETNEAIEVRVFVVVGGLDQNQVASLNGTSDATTGDISLSTGVLPSGTYHVMMTVHPTPTTFFSSNATVVIP